MSLPHGRCIVHAIPGYRDKMPVSHEAVYNLGFPGGLDAGKYPGLANELVDSHLARGARFIQHGAGNNRCVRLTQAQFQRDRFCGRRVVAGDHGDLNTAGAALFDGLEGFMAQRVDHGDHTEKDHIGHLMIAR